MDRLNQLRGEAGGSGDSSLDATSAPSDAYLTATDSSKYFSLLEDESSFNISKDAVIPEQEASVADSPIISDLSPIPKKSDLDSYKIGEQIEAANILSGGVNIFDDNENSYDGDELVIDDNATVADEKTRSESKLIDDVEYSKVDSNLAGTVEDADPVIPSKDTEVVLQIDGKNVDAIDIGNGLYLYRKDGEEELAAVQIIDDDQQQPSFKFLKVRENSEGNLEVYEEIEIEVPKEVPIKEVKPVEHVSPVTMQNVDKNFDEPSKVEKRVSTIQKDAPSSETKTMDFNKELQYESKTEVNLNGKMIKFSESRKSPVVGSFTPMTFHSTPNKEGIPLTKTMVDQHLHPSRYSDNAKKTIEVHTDSSKQRILDTPVKNHKEVLEIKAELPEKECKQPLVEIEDRQKYTQQKVSDVQESMNVKIANCGEVEDDIKSSTEIVNIVQVSDTVTNAEVIFNKTAENAINKTKCFKDDNNINLPVTDYELQTEATENKKLLESSKVVDNIINVQEVIPNEVVSSKVDLNEEKVIEGLGDTPVASTKEEAPTVVSDLKDNEKKDSVVISNESEGTKKNMLNSSNEILSTIDNKKNTCEPKTELLNNEPIEVVSDKLTPDEQKELQSNILNSEIDVDQHQDNLQTKEVMKLSDKECVDLDANFNTYNQVNVIPTDEALKTNLVENRLTKNHNKDDDCSKVHEPIKVSTKETNIESKVCTVSIKENEKVDQLLLMNKIQSDTKKEETMSKINNDTNIKNVCVNPANNNNTAVPFGKWTEANRQEFLNKIKEAKVPSNTSNTKQIKQPNDLNRRDILQKIDSQRQQQSNNSNSKVQEKQKSNSKVEPSAFVKSAVKHDTKIPVKERPAPKSKPICNKKNMNETSKNPIKLPDVTIPNVNKKESLQRREINNQDLIDKTIEGIINRVPHVVKASKEECRQKVQNTEGIEKQKGMTLFGPSYHAKNEQSVTLDEIEMKMNELHGIPFVERPAHELPQKFTVDTLQLKTESYKNTSSQSKISTPNQLSIVLQQTSQQETMSEVVVSIDSDEEIIEHEPITGDINPKKKSTEMLENAQVLDISQMQKVNEPRKKDVIITEKDFDKFFRRNSVTYENCLTVNFDGKEPHNVVQTVVEKDVAPKKLTRNEVLLAESKAKSTHKLQMLQARHNNNASKIPTTAKNQMSEDESYGKNYQSKLQIAYQSALTAKRQKESPIIIIEEKPVKVVFMESSSGFIPSQLNVQGEKLSPVKQFTSDLETFTHSTTDSLDSDILDNYDNKSHDEAKAKTKHQRKQVLTPVETADMELIEPNDLGIDISPKKKRKIEEKPEKSYRNHVPKKSYLLGRTNFDEKIKAQDVDKASIKEITNHNSFVGHSNPISAIDNLVKAAELLETQAESNINSTKTEQNTPVKRGRGRPRKYPLPDAEANKIKAPSPQKKPRLIDAKVIKREETDEDETSDGEIIKENWTMGKINENIVCPICGKLFRSENVVFKHVKHCTGPSPNRSESDKRRLRESRDSDQSILDLEENEVKKKRKSKESVSKSSTHSDEVVVIEETPLTEKSSKQHISRKSMAKPKLINKHNLACEICGKIFRQSSYLAHHKLLHKNDDLRKHDKETNDKKSIFSCEVCKKEFRKLHHLVHHKIIHNPDPVPSRTLRKSSLEQTDGSKVVKEQTGVKQNEDQSAGFRCEPCDKSFRKLHHLVEHRETHDGINRQKATEVETVKPVPLHRCDICDKTFKKLQLLNEHKDQHLETCSEKSDDKSVKSCLSTKDIIHECSLCYMVFPNEHSLNKHTVICLRKKKQSAAKAKQAALKKESEGNEVNSEHHKSEESDPNDKDEDSLIIIEDHDIQDVIVPKKTELSNDKPAENLLSMTIPNKSDPIIPINSTEITLTEQKEANIVESIKEESSELTTVPKENLPVKAVTEIRINKEINIPAETQQSQTKQREEQVTQKIPHKQIHKQIHKKRTPAKDKLTATVTKRQKTVDLPLPVTEEMKLFAESSDDDDVRYMLNPDFKENEQQLEAKNFMNVKAKKRNSLQIEWPKSKDLLKRRISLQNPPKVSRLKSKLLEQKPVPATSAKPAIPKIEKQVPAEPVDCTDSEDSETKYAFPETIKQNTATAPKVEKRKPLELKRKSLSGIAKRKSLGKAMKSKHKAHPTQAKPIKRRTMEVEHRCDCGKLFSSAALLSRHTTLDHTPPRIRRRRSLAPVADEKSVTKLDNKPAPQTARRGAGAAKTRASERESATAGKSGVATRNSSMSIKAAHRGVPVPERLRKAMEKSKI